jgi:hypothetical protein
MGNVIPILFAPQIASHVLAHFADNPEDEWVSCKALGLNAKSVGVEVRKFRMYFAEKGLLYVERGRLRGFARVQRPRPSEPWGA